MVAGISASLRGAASVRVRQVLASLDARILAAA